ncbi:hypothetical protein CGS53_10320 [Faecalibacterium prausnitzii]|nr:hypothetical protein CGS53_10320 [Faecalibacterium prausnitzii]
MKPKRLISLLVAVCMMITMLPLSAVTAFAEDTSAPTGTASYGDYEYDYTINTEDGTATITKFRALVDGSYDITIPTDFGRFPVTAIGDDAFRGCSALKKVTIPQSVTSIGDSAFAGCHNLDSVTINDAATSIGNRAFTECPLTTTLSLGKKITTIGDEAFYDCRGLTSVTIPPSVTSIGKKAFLQCIHLKTLSFGENIKTNIETIGDEAFYYCIELESVTIPQSVTSIGNDAFGQCHDLQSLTIKDAATSIGHRAFLGCTSLETISLGENIKTIGYHAFNSCTSINLTNVTIPENVTTIRPGTFDYCTHLEYIMLPAGLTSFRDSLEGCPDGNPNGAIYYKNYKAAADALLADNDDNSNIDDNDKLKKRNFLYLCKVTFDAKGGNLTYDKVPVYETEKITETLANNLEETDLDAINHPTRTGYNFIGWYTTPDGKPEDGKFDVKETAITKDITLYARWKFDPNALDCHQLTVTGGIVTVKNGDKDVTDTLTVTTDETTGKKTYDVPDGAKVTVTLDKTLIPKGNAFDGWSTGNLSLTGQDYKAESITFTMSSDVDIAAQYRDAATDHTPDTAVCHPLTVTGGTATVEKDGQTLDIVPVVTGDKKTYSVPDGAKVTVTLDKTPIPEDMVFDSWSTGKFSLPLGQDYKAESITFTMNSGVDIAAQYRDASIEDDGPNVLGTAAIIGTAAVGTAVLGYQAYSLGTEFAGKLMALPYFPSNRSALAMMLWEDAGKPMPESELLYPDVGQEEQDMDLQHAARWAMENELIPDLNDEDTAPEEMKFFPANPVSKLDVLNAWQKAQELKNN